MKVRVILQQPQTINQLERSFLSEDEENRRLNRLFEETLAKVIRGEAFRQKCLVNTPYSSFGWWIRSQPEYDLDDAQTERLKTQVKYAHTIYMKWETIVENLTDPAISKIDARKLVFRTAL